METLTAPAGNSSSEDGSPDVAAEPAGSPGPAIAAYSFTATITTIAGLRYQLDVSCIAKTLRGHDQGFIGLLKRDVTAGATSAPFATIEAPEVVAAAAAPPALALQRDPAFDRGHPSRPDRSSCFTGLPGAP